MNDRKPEEGLTPISIGTSVSADRRTITVQLQPDGSRPVELVADASFLDDLLRAVGRARAEMLEPVPSELIGVHPLSAFNPCWFVVPDTTNSYATMWIRHPGLGWSGYGFPRHEAGNIAKWFRKVTTFTTTRDTQSPAASSFGGDSFLITTEGLGFYYYGKGEKRIGPNPFEQVEFDSDRAAGIVAGSIVETRLEQAVQSRLRPADTKKLEEIKIQLFRPSGALGPFGTKIDLAYLMRILSDDAFRDLTIVKTIRNDFAHKLEHDSFDIPSIKDRCANLTLVDRHIGPIPDFNVELSAPPSRPSPYFGLPDYQQKLADPRFRYTMTTQLIAFALSEGSDSPEAELPLI